jgi:hypothetical protein
MKQATASTLGTIDAGKSYPLKLFQQLTGLGAAALRRYRRQGFAVIYLGRCGYVLGDDWFAFLQSAKREPMKR